jgi:hypothetical protein
MEEMFPPETAAPEAVELHPEAFKMTAWTIPLLTLA